MRMSPERYRQIQSILQAALEIDPGGQGAFLEEACRGDPDLKAEVESLLDHDAKAAGFLEKPPVATGKAAVRLPPGSHLGPYEIVEPIGAGGMGEVYRARDPRFPREVAIKLLPSAFADDHSHLARFEREARAAGSLNHPNILTVHDFGRQNGVPYLVSELLRGTTLRERLEHSAIAPAEAVACAAQIARGLGAAHAIGIVHRDLKPENVFLVRGGLVKILDFGLAKLPDVPAVMNQGAAAGLTGPGMVLGTLGYMSPEQVRAETADHRSDIFSLGVILYEMLTGKRPFAGETWVDETTAILRQAVPDLPPVMAGIADPAALNRILRRCLAKPAEDRFESARDLAFALEPILAQTGPNRPPKAGRRALWGTVAAVALATGAFLAAYSFRAIPSPAFQRLTFRRGIVSAARFTADGNTIVYSAAWDGGDFRLYTARPGGGPESRPLEQSGGMLFAVSSRSDVALCLPTGRTQHGMIGNLAQVPLSGGGTLDRAEGVSAADWSPDGSKLAVVRVENERPQIEYPIGRVLYRARLSSGYMEALRVSPRGGIIAFLDHPLHDDSAGWVATVDLAGHYRTISSRFNSMRGLAWSPDGAEVWFAAARQGTHMAVWAVTPSGRERLVAHFPAYISVEDISPDRRVLISLHTLSESMVHVAEGGEAKDLYWHDQSQVRDISRDSGTILFSESGDATRLDYDAYLRKADLSSPAVHLGDGLPLALSPDGRWAIANPAGSPAPLTLLPAGPGDPRPLAADRIDHAGAVWLPDGKGFIFAGISPGENLRYYVQALEGGTPQPITGPDVLYERRSPIVVSPDGRRVAAVDREKRVRLYSTDPAAPSRSNTMPNLAPGFTPLQWCPDDRLVLHRYDELPPQLWTADVSTGKLAAWKQLIPPNPVGLLDLTPIRVSPDCRSYAFSPLNVLSQVYLVTGLR
jgi:serine/threonine protein kinase/dipeptidyl aminopeptidase/acylaminoacyl peptidase